MVAVFLLALMLPIQGWAAACAQICALANAGAGAAHEAVVNDGRAAAGAPESAPEHDIDHCGKSELGAGKCCQAHAFVVRSAEVFAGVSIPSFERVPLVARWTSFVPEEPNPPPIGAAPIA